MSETISYLCVKYRWVLFFLSLLFSLVGGYGLKYFVVDGSPKALIDEGNDDLERLELLEDEFGRTNNAVILLGPKDEIGAQYSNFMFGKEQISALSEITSKSWLLPRAVRVDSITNYQHSWSEGDDLYVDSLLDEYQNLSEEKVEYVISTLTNEPGVVRRIITEDGNRAGVIVKFQVEDGDQETENLIGESIYNLAGEIEKKYPSIDVSLSGTIVNNYVTMQVAVSDTSRVIGVMYLVMFALLAIMLRSVKVMLSIITITVFTVITGLGIACWFGTVFTSMSLSASSIIITVAIAHCVHLIMGFQISFNQGMDKISAIEKSLKINLKPVFLTSLTTIIGFASMNLSSLPPVRNIGNISACGVAVAFFLSYTMLPALISSMRFKRRVGTNSVYQNFMQFISSFVVKNHKILLLISTVTCVFSVYLATQNVINDRMYAAIDKPHFIRDDNEIVDKHLGGIYNIQYQLAADRMKSITDPEYLISLDRFTEFLRSQPDVTNVFSFSDVIKRLNKNLHSDDQKWYRVPENQELAAQYLLLYEMSLPAGVDLSNQVAVDKMSTRLVVTFASTDSVGVNDLRKRISDWMDDNLPTYMHYKGLSYITVWTDLSLAALSTSLEGALVALAIISFMLVIVFRSTQYGLVSIIPNLLPAALGFAFWKLYSGELQFGLMMVLTITIGIVVDDTVHFLAKYKQAIENGAKTASDAVREAFINVGPALLITTTALVSGFMVMAASQFFSNSTLGILVSAVLLSALLLDFLMLPPLLIMLKLGIKRDKNNSL